MKITPFPAIRKKKKIISNVKKKINKKKEIFGGKINPIDIKKNKNKNKNKKKTRRKWLNIGLKKEKVTATRESKRFTADVQIN